MTFILHPQLSADTAHVCDLPLCRVLLMNNKHFPWLVLVPMRGNICELHELAMDDYRQAMSEVRHISDIFQKHTGAHKMNVAALGNIVPQLHIHIIARFTHDAAWPKPVWGSATAPYTTDDLKAAAASIAKIINGGNITKM